MRIFYDCEFIEDGRTIDLISIGMVRWDDGEELYLVNEEIDSWVNGAESPLYEKIRKHDWLMENVIPQLPLRLDRGKPMVGKWEGRWSYHLDMTSNLIVPKRYITNAVRDFVLADQDIHDDGSPVAELWGYYSAYDHVLLCQLFGPMGSLPKGFPMWTNDIQQEHQRLLRAGTHPTGVLPEQPTGQHNALEDARWNMQAWKSLKLA
jgi:hypothetical protein